MFLENQKRTKNNLFIKNDFKNIDKKIIIFLCAFLVNLIKINDGPILIVTPFLILGYLLGFSYLIIAIMGAFIGSLLFSPLVFYATCLFILLFLISTILFKLTKIKVQIRMLIGGYISDVFSRYIYEIGIKNELTINPLFYSIISLILSYLIIIVAEYLLNEETKQYPYQVALSILFLISFSLIGLDYNIFGISILFIVLSTYFVFSAKILDFSIFCCFLFLNLLALLFLNKFNNSLLFLLFIPPIVTTIIKNKYINLTLYLISSFLLILFLKLDKIYILASLLVSLLSICIPSLLISHIKDAIVNPLNNLKLYEKKYQKQEREIETELSKVSSLFSLIVEEYDKDGKERLERKKESIIYHSLCVNCHKNKICYGKNQQLKNLMFKYIESELNERDIDYINKECLKPSKYFEMGEIFRKDYFKEYKYYLEYTSLKDALKNQMKGLKMVLDNYADKLRMDNSLEVNYENRIIRDLLDQNQIDVLYVNAYEDIKNNININLCVKINDHQDIYKIKNIISNKFNVNLEINNVSNYSLDGFLKIEFKEVREYKILYGIYQVNLKEDGNGDSYLVYENNNYIIYCLSDGMGSGKLAKEESRFTLKVLKSILDTGMDLKNGISLMNALLKIKNRYEMYATLDLVSINKKSLKSHFFKNGAMHSYIYSNLENRLIRINSSSLPIGIVDNVISRDYSYKLRDKDFIIMISDGVKENEELLETFFKQIKDYNPQLIAREINMRFKNKDELDDASVMVIKIEK